jgi:multidrug efflux pump subunit AcrA (membrane-fusion protein)
MASSDSAPLTASCDAPKEATEGSASSRYRLRADLRIVNGAAGGVTPSDVTVIDSRSGEQQVFTADEFRLCQAANGTSTLAGIRQAFQAQTGREISYAKLLAFFRRLRSLGLLQEGASDSGADKPDETGMGGTADRSIKQDDSLLIAGRGLVSDPSAPLAGAIVTASHSKAAADITPSGPLPAGAKGSIPSTIATIPGPEPALDSVATELSDDRRAPRRRWIQSRWRVDKPVSLRTGTDLASAQAVATDKAVAPIAPKAEEKADQAEKLAAARGAGEDFEDLKALASADNGNTSRTPRQGVRGRKRDAKRVETSRAAGSTDPLRPETPESSAPLAGPGGPAGNLTDTEDFGAAFGGGAGGALRAVLGGAEGRGLGGGAMQALFAGRAQRGRAERQHAVAERTTDANEPARVSLFNPNAALGLIAALVWPLKYALVPFLLLVAAAIAIAYHQREFLTQDIRAFDVSVVGTIILGLSIGSFISRLTQGTFIRLFGAAVKQFGIRLSFGIPRFFVDLGGIASLERHGQLWAYAAPLIARLGLFCAGTLLWFALRESAPSQAHLALVMGQIGLFAFLFSVFPLLPSDGYRWLATFFGQPALRADALASVPGRLSQDADEAETASNLAALTFYVLAVAFAVSLLALVAQAYFDVAATGDIGWLTKVLLVGVCIALAAWAVALWQHGRGRIIAALDSDATHQVLTDWTGKADVASDKPVSVGTIGKIFWAVVACALLAVAFLPYRYQAGGKFEILPAERTIVSVRTSGELKQVLVHDGDWVKANQMLAKLSSDDQQRAISITNAELQHARAQLAQFGGGMTTSAQSGLEQSIADAFRDDPDIPSAKKAQTAANYATTQAERAARTEVERLTRKLAFERDQLRQTDVRAPKEGRVVTPNVHLLTGIWLRQGAKLLVLDDTHTLEAEVNVPEADIAAVKVDDKVRLRPWSNDDREIAGRVTQITPTAQPTSYGMVVRVRVSIPNSEEFLRPAMTGYAKIDGQDMRVWEAFLRRIIRIVRVEMWSWIP